MAKNENRKKFLKNAGILGLAGLFGLSKMGNMPVVKAAVNDNAEAKDISNDVIRCNTNDVFTSGETAADLADAVNGLNQSFSNALTDLKNTDVAKAVGANGSKFPTVIGVLGAIKTYLSGAVSKDVQVGSSYKIPEGYHDGTSAIKAVAKSGTNPTQITTNGTHSTGGYESVNVQVSAKAVFLGTYSVDTVIDISNFDIKEPLIENFIAIPESLTSSGNASWNNSVSEHFTIYATVDTQFIKEELKLYDNYLEFKVPIITTTLRGYMTWGTRNYGPFSFSKKIPCKVYFIETMN